MGFTELLTIIFIFLKVFGLINWSWLLVFLPEIIMIAIYIVLVFVNISIHKKAKKRFDKFWDEF